ncbi:MAG: hypothetical protein ACR2GR_03045 [Rhodothermales bacterium]
MIWLFFALFACGLVAWLLTALRRYERESAAVAREHIEALEAELARVVERVQTLEAIAAADPAEPDVRVRFEEDAPATATSAPASVSSATPPASLPPRQRSR